MSIRTVRTDGMGLFQSVHDRKIASHLGDLEYISRFTEVKGVSQVVDPYSLYRWNTPLSIGIRSENCISLRLRIYSTSYWSEGVSRVVDPYGPYGRNRPFSIRTRSENCISIKGT